MKIYEALDHRWTFHESLCGRIWVDVEMLMAIIIIVLMGCLDFIAYIKYLAHCKVRKNSGMYCRIIIYYYFLILFELYYLLHEMQFQQRIYL